MALFRAAGGRYHGADALAHLGDALHAAGHLAAARDAWQQAVEILDELDHPDAKGSGRGSKPPMHGRRARRRPAKPPVNRRVTAW